MSRYTQLVSAPAGERRMRVAVVGAGLAGLTTARVLQDQGHDVVVVEKARGPGGRMATRRHEPWCFDHGAQYFTARDPRFLRHVEAWRERGLVEAWEGRIGVLEGGRILAAGSGTERFVAVPGMSAICRTMAAELADCRFDWQVQSAIFEADAWRLQAGDNSHLEADALVISTPPDQVGPLLPQMFLSESVDQSLQGLDMEPCWALMAVFDRPLLADWDAAFVNEGALSWVCSQASRPARPDAAAWVLHATPQWSRANLEVDAAEAAAGLLDAAHRLPDAAGAQTLFETAHRWRFAVAREPLDCEALWFGDYRLAVAGDWCAGSRVEGAFLSGAAAAGRLLGCGYARPVAAATLTRSGSLE
jgi:predicted NAD/FAD-dependent oxidoreductase